MIAGSVEEWEIHGGLVVPYDSHFEYGTSEDLGNG